MFFYSIIVPCSSLWNNESMSLSDEILGEYAKFCLQYSFEFFLVTDNELLILESSTSFREKFPPTKETDHLIDLVSDPERERFLAFYRNANDDMQFMQVLLVLKDQTVQAEVHYQKHEKYVFWAVKDTSELIAIREDLITNRSKIAAEKARSEAMLNCIGDGVIGVDDRGDITYINEQALGLLGFSKDELLGKPFIHTIKVCNEKGIEITQDKRPIHLAMFSRSRIETRDQYYIRKDGSRFPVDITATSVMLFDQVIGGVSVFRDITKERDIDRMKTEFISLASHQLRTPLSAMKWFGELLLGGDVGVLTEDQKEMVQQIYQSNERMIELVNALLNISRIESGRIIIEPEPTNLQKLIDEVVVEVRPRLDKKKQKLVISVHEGLPDILIDPKLVRHVYMNLLTNAIKYTPDEGEIQVLVSREGDNVISQVTDSGYGIPKAQQGSVFSKFFRAENILKVETDGTGLGLYLTKAVVDSSGGKIWFSSEEGKGTTFWFSLPMSGMKKKEGEVTIDA